MELAKEPTRYENPAAELADLSDRIGAACLDGDLTTADVLSEQRYDLWAETGLGRTELAGRAGTKFPVE